MIEDASGRLDPGSIGRSEHVALAFLDESFLTVLRFDAGARALFSVERHVDGYRDGSDVCIARSWDDGAPALEWWQRGLFRVDWSRELLAAHPALASEEERAVLRLEPVPHWVTDEPSLPRFERDPVSSALVRFSVPADYFVSEIGCTPDCVGAMLRVRHVFTRPER